MNSTKSALLKRQYKRQRSKYLSGSFDIILADGEPIEKRFKRLIELTSVSAEEAVNNINVALMGKAFHGTPVFVSEFTRSVRLWAIIRSYHLIEITIAIAVGVYLWLK